MTDGLLKRIKVTALSAALALVIAGCGSSALSGSSGHSDSYSIDESASDYAVGMKNAYYDSDAYGDEYYSEDSTGYSSDSAEASEAEYGDKIITTYNYSFETKKFDESIEALTGYIDENGGYVESSSVSGTEGYRYAYYTVRIPTANVDTFIEESGDIGTAISVSSSVEDVTSSYYDIEEHKKALQAQYDRLLELMETAESVEDIISIEDRMSELEYQMNSYQTQLKLYDNRVNYTTFNIDIDEVTAYTPSKQTLWSRITDQFEESCGGIVDFFEALVVFVVGNIPIWIILALAVALVIVIIKTIRKARAKRRNRRYMAEQAKLQAEAVEKETVEDGQD